MSNFNYCIGGAWSNPVGEIQKITNELPDEEKAKPVVKKKNKKTAKKTKRQAK